MYVTREGKVSRILPKHCVIPETYVDTLPSGCYTFEKRYYVSDLIARFVCVCLSVNMFVARWLNMASSEVNTIYKNLKIQH